MSQWMCELCFPTGVELGVVLPGYSLMLLNEQYHLLGGQGHNGHILLTFNHRPFPDPDPESESTDQEVNALSDLWLEHVLEPIRNLKLSPQDGHDIVESAKEFGWHYENCNFDYWLADRCGVVAAEWEKSNEG